MVIFLRKQNPEIHQLEIQRCKIAYTIQLIDHKMFCTGHPQKIEIPHLIEIPILTNNPQIEISPNTLLFYPPLYPSPCTS